MEIKLSVDRIVGDKAICYRDEQKFVIPSNGLRSGLLIIAHFENGEFISFEPLEEETKKIQSELKKRTSALFSRGKNASRKDKSNE